jgi:hypothetical protein
MVKHFLMNLAQKQNVLERMCMLKKIKLKTLKGVAS